MYNYRLSLILEYSPLLEVNYFASSLFEIADVVEVVFNKRTVKAVVLEKQGLKEAKFAVRTANFKTQKILSTKKLFAYDKGLFENIKEISDKQIVSVGEILWYLFGDLEPKKNDLKRDSQEIAEVFFDTLSFAKAKFINPKSKGFYKSKDFIEKVSEGKSFKQITLHVPHHFAGVLPTRPHLDTVPILELFCKYFLPESDLMVERNDNINARKFFIDRIVDEDATKVVKKKEKAKLISDESLQHIEEVVRVGGKAFVFVLNHGYVLRLYCYDCGKYRVCPLCKQAEQYVVDGEQSYAWCKQCDLKKILKKDELLLCEYCGSYDLNSFGLGIKKVGEYVQDHIETDILIADEKDKRITDKRLIEKVNSEDVKLVVGTLRALRAAVGVCDMVLVVSLGKLDLVEGVRSLQQKMLLDEISHSTKKMYIERLLSNQEKKNLDDKSFQFWENYKKGSLPETLGLTVTIAVPYRKYKNIASIITQIKPTAFYKKGNFNIYIFTNLSENLARELVEVGRRAGDVFVGEVPREFTFTLK